MRDSHISRNRVWLVTMIEEGRAVDGGGGTVAVAIGTRTRSTIRDGAT